VRITTVASRSLPISSSIRNAWIDFTGMDCTLVAVVSDQIQDGHPVVGYGFSSNGRYSASDLLKRRFIPRLMSAPAEELLNGDGDLEPARAWEIVMKNEKPGGHGERSVAVGALDMALYDLAAKLAGQPLYRYLSERYADGSPDDRVFVYAAGGYYAPDKSCDDLAAEMSRFLDGGYRVVKMKIGGAPLTEDLRRIEAVLDVLGGDGSRLAVDVNGRFDLKQALAYAEALAPYGLFWFEEVGDPLDFQLQATLSSVYSAPMATGENLFSLQDARNLIRYGGMRPDRDYLQFDPSLSYGLTEYLRILDMLAEHGWSPRRCMPHGGHQFSVHIAAALKLGGNESYPGEFWPTGGFDDDAVVEGGYIRLSEAPGVGFENKRDLIKVMRDLHR
jgi:L-alanine-DL-glutamate epimerase-like enolase superfamily enzyme